LTDLSQIASSPEILLSKIQIQLANPSSSVDFLYHFDSFNKDANWQKTFFSAMQETISKQEINYRFYSGLMSISEFEINSLKSFDDISQIPFITSGVLKKFNLSSTEAEKHALNVTSSGTTGQKVNISLDEVSLIRIISGILKSYSEMSLASGEINNYLFASYSPQASNSAGTAGTDQVVSHLTPRGDTFYALDFDENGKTVFLKDQAVKQLRKYVEAGLPIRILGFLHYSCEIIKSYFEIYGEVKFPENSYILSGGGWKEFAKDYGSDFNLYDYLGRITNLKASSIRDSYSLVEHPVLYVACEKNKLHVSALAHVVIRDVNTMKVLGYGQSGLVQLFTPILQSYPSASLMTSDIGSLEKGCSCGRSGDVLKIEGRGGSTKQMTCALNAEQYLVGANHAK
jgi:hypothetical protein